MKPGAALSGRRVLVTGAAGFIGTHLVSRLLDVGAHVHAVARGDSSARQVTGVSWRTGDLAEIAVVREMLQTVRPELIYHLASHVAGSRALDLVLPTFRSNLMSTVNLLTGALEVGGARVILSGSLEEPESVGIDAVPCSPYAAAKGAASAYGRMFAALYELPVTILRLFMVYGPGQRDVTKLVPYVTRSLLRGEAPRLSSGVREVDWVFVEDAVEAFLLAGDRSGLEGKTIDVGSGRLTTVREVVEQLVDIVKPPVSPAFGVLPERSLERVVKADAARSASLLGWRTQTSLREGLERTVEWYARAIGDGAT